MSSDNDLSDKKMNTVYFEAPLVSACSVDLDTGPMLNLVRFAFQPVWHRSVPDALVERSVAQGLFQETKVPRLVGRGIVET